MGSDYSKQRDELKDSVIKIMYLADHQCKSVTVENHKDIILKIFDVINEIPNPTNVPIGGILQVLTFIINQTTATTSDNDQTISSSMLKNVLTEAKIVDIQNYFQSLKEYLKNHYPYVRNNDDKIQQLNAEIKTVREHCTTLYNAMMEKNKIPVDPFWFYVAGIKIHLLLLKELIKIGSLNEQSYNTYMNEYCQKINQLKLKFMNPQEIKFKYSYLPDVEGDINSLSFTKPELLSHDGKIYKIITAKNAGLLEWGIDSSPYEKLIKNTAQEYYDEQMAKIDSLIENLRSG